MDQTIDILDRQKFCDDILKIIMALSEKKKGCTFAIDGIWGVGKTYIVEMLERQLEPIQCEETADNRFYVFHYNCWQYDYYDEPAIAVVSALLEKMNSGMDAQIEGKVKDAWESAKKIIEKISGDFIKNKIGIDLVDVYNSIEKNGKERKKETYEFDDLFAFKRTLDETRKQIKLLAENKTVVLVVDELDRCLPTYAIKVLERLHHMFEGIDNVIVLMAIDSIQLEHSVKEIYGDSVDTDRYLHKFISFRVRLRLGDIQPSLVEKYDYYFGKFENVDSVISQLLEFIDLCEFDIRRLDQIIERLNLVHDIVCDRMIPASVLYFEMLYGLLLYKQSANGLVEDSMYWLPEIDHATYVGLDKQIGERMIQFLKDSKKSIEKGTIVNGMEASLKVIKTDEVGIGFWLLDQVLAKKKSFYLEKTEKYEDLLNICRNFYELEMCIV